MNKQSMSNRTNSPTSLIRILFVVSTIILFTVFAYFIFARISAWIKSRAKLDDNTTTNNTQTSYQNKSVLDDLANGNVMNCLVAPCPQMQMQIPI